MADDTAAGVPAPSFASLDFIFLYIAFGDDQTRVIKYIGSMETASNGTQSAVKSDEEKTRYIRRTKLRELNANPQSTGKRALPSGWINQS